MATVVAIMDHHALTDNIVVIAPESRQVIWIPRDTYSTLLEDRINIAYKRGGAALLLEALANLGVQVQHCLCLSRATTERGLLDVKVYVPVEFPQTYRYPFNPNTPIEMGYKMIAFHPPGELLEGEKIHQWIGARYGTRPFYTQIGGDLDRCVRQQIFVKNLLSQGYNFNSFIHEDIQITGREALIDLAQVNAYWSFETLKSLTPIRIHEKSVLWCYANTFSLSQSSH